MSSRVELILEPAGRSLAVEAGVLLQDELFAQGVEFPCGGRARCRGCRVRLLRGESPPTPDDAERLTASELKDGWRLACRLRASAPLTLEIAQWEALILGDDSVLEVTPRDGFGIAIDLGTTTIVAQILDLRTGRVIGVRTLLNPQARYGADLMSRVDHASTPEGRERLTTIIREHVGRMVRQLVAVAATPERSPGTEAPVTPPVLEEILLVGNTVMHHLFSGLPVESLGQHPFDPVDPGLQSFTAAELGWAGDTVSPGVRVHFLPCLGSFVGSDILAGILATRLHLSSQPGLLVDLGTNGEMVVGNRDRLFCASTAAGPAFEGARIVMGMRAATGAISEVRVRDGTLHCHVIGGAQARGICGSGLVDAVACGLDLGLVQPNGRLFQGQPLRLEAPIELSQCDIRELQLAKGAIAAGIRLLAERWGTSVDGLAPVCLAGAFGNYINRGSARTIGLLPFAPDRVTPSGNAALLGAKMALLRIAGSDLEFKDLRQRVEHVAMNHDPTFVDRYVAEMNFPKTPPYA
ncbi:MAG: DUF4445 domain-containing protein [Verrucomicrobiales bacterium]|nr:DUF4445 domain-containing protein [Verrucomicrobiales bacterium]